MKTCTLFWIAAVVVLILLGSQLVHASAGTIGVALILAGVVWYGLEPTAGYRQQ